MACPGAIIVAAWVDGDNGLDLWTIQSVTDAEGNGDTVIARVPFKRR